MIVYVCVFMCLTIYERGYILFEYDESSWDWNRVVQLLLHLGSFTGTSDLEFHYSNIVLVFEKEVLDFCWMKTTTQHSCPRLVRETTPSNISLIL